ncbi:MAG: porin family protein [Salinibacter sp.]|uniref:porin family protein n=1 Tax=Salinibacter sp. TaxID=2065818 RepID=UPI0035D44159
MRHCASVLLLGGLLVMIPMPAQGQSGLQYGLTLGVNRATLESPAALGSRWSFVGGGVVRTPSYGPLALQSELLLSQEGAEVGADDGGAIEYGAGYLELPLLVHLTAPPVQSVSAYGEAGGFGAVKLFERQTPGTGNLNIPIPSDATFFDRFNAGIVLGIGATISIGERKFNLAVRRKWGLVDVTQNVENQPFSDLGAEFPTRGRTRTWSAFLRLGL